MPTPPDRPPRWRRLSPAGRWLVAALLLALGDAAAAQSVSASVSDSQVFVGETVTYTVTLRGGRATRVGPPLASGALRLVSQTPTLDATTIMNGKVERSVAWVYEATRAGTGRIGRFVATVAGKRVEARAIPVTVQAGGPSRPPAPSAPTSGSGELFVRAEPSRQSAVVGQQVVVDYVLYFEPQVQPRQTAPVGTWDAPGAWREEMEIATAYPRQTTYNGRSYDAVTIRRVALFPTRSGALELAPMRFTVDVIRVDRSFSNDPFAPFFAPFRQRFDDVEVTAPGITVDVADLPPGAPPSFTGAVGQFSMTTTISDETVAAGEAVRVQVALRGDGNIATLEAPALQAVPGLDAYAPRDDREISRGGTALRGIKTFTYTLVPQGGGTFEVPGTPWTYFDPTDGQYKTLIVDPVEIEASGAPLAAAPAAADPNGLVGLMSEARWQRPTARPVWLWGLLGGGLALPVVAFVLLAGARKGRERLTADTPARRSRRAAADVRRRLAAARGSAGPAACAEVERATRAFLTDRFGVPAGPLSPDSIDAALAQRDVPEALRQRVRQLSAACTRGQFAPGLAGGDVVAEAEATLAALDAASSGRRR